MNEGDKVRSIAFEIRDPCYPIPMINEKLTHLLSGAGLLIKRIEENPDAFLCEPANKPNPLANQTKKTF